MWTYLAKFLTYNALGLKKLYDQNSHEWKLFPMDFINNAFGKNFHSKKNFHSNFSFKTSVKHQLPTFYENILQLWKGNFSHISYTLL